MTRSLLKYYPKREESTEYIIAKRKRKARACLTRTVRRPRLFQTTLGHYLFRINFENPCVINRLPPELLMEILSYASSATKLKVRVHADPFVLPISDDDAYDSDESDNINDPKPGWYILALAEECNGHRNCLAEVRFRNGCARFCSSQPWNFLDVLRVCKQWRDTAYHWPQFWTKIAIQNTDAIVRSLKLSGSLPINIYSSNSVRDTEKWQWPSVDALGLALDCLSRVRVLDMHFTPFSDADWSQWTQPVITRLRRLPAPRLSTLRLKFGRSHTDDSIVIRTEDWVQKEFSALRSLELCAAKIYSPCALLAPTLTELTLADCEAPWKTAVDFLQTFAGLPQLRILSVTRTEYPKDFDDERLKTPSDTTLPIPMDHLRSIELHGSFRFVNRVLAAFAFPLDSTTLKLEYRHDVHGVNLGRDSEGALLKARDMFASYALAMPPKTHFDSIDLDFDLDERYIEVTLSQADPSEVTVSLKHSWTEEHDSHAGDILNFIRQTSSPLFSSKRTTSMTILLTGYCDLIAASSPTFTLDACYDWVAGLTALRFIRLSSEAISTFITWMVRRLHVAAGLPPSGEDEEEEEEGSDSDRDSWSWNLLHSRYMRLKPRPKLKTTLPFPNLRRLVLNECDLQAAISEGASTPVDLLFSHLWLYLHAQQPQLVLMDTELTHRMLRELRRKLGASRLEEHSIWPVSDDPYIRVSRHWSDTAEELHITSKAGKQVIRQPRWSVYYRSGEREDE